MAETDFINVWRVNRLAELHTFQTGEWRCFLSCCLVGKGEIGQAETGAVVFIEIACQKGNVTVNKDSYDAHVVGKAVMKLLFS